MIESKVTHGNRKQVYVVISPSNGRYVIVHRTKNKRVCNLSGHDGEKCEHTALLPKIFMNERYEHASDYDSDDQIGLTEILEKLEKTKDVAPIEEVSYFVRLVSKLFLFIYLFLYFVTYVTIFLLFFVFILT